MPTALADRLTEQYAQQNRAVQANSLRAFLRVWPLLDFARLDDTFPALLDAVLPIVGENRVVSASLAARYVRGFRLAEGVGGDVDVVLAPRLDARVETALRVTSVVAAKRAARGGQPLELVKRKTLTIAAGSVSRLVADAGRETLHRTLDEDRKALGYERVAKATACDFCRMLAGRGAVYKTAETAGETRRYHDACGCRVVPLYRD